MSLLTSTRSSDVILQMKSQFSHHGNPRELISDNGPQFSCAEFTRFASSWGLKHSTSSLKHPQSNGSEERSIQTLKNLLKKAEASQQDPYLALLQFRTTPLPNGVSPAQLLMNRRLRTRLPTTDAQLRPNVAAQEHVQQAAARRQRQQAKGYNKTALARPLAPLQPGQGVWVQMEWTSMWRPVTVVSAAAAPRSYVVRTPDGAKYRRNRAMLRPTSEPPPSLPQPEVCHEPKTIDVPEPGHCSRRGAHQASPASDHHAVKQGGQAPHMFPQ